MNLDFSTLNPNDPGALILAIVRRTKQDVALKLLEAGADVDARDESGIPAAAYAAALGRKKVFDDLARRGADLYAVDDAGRSIARHLAESLAGGSHFATPSDLRAARSIARQLLDTLPAQPEDELLLILAFDAQAKLKEKLNQGLDPDMMIEGSLGIIGLTRDDLIQKCIEAGGLLEAFVAGTLPLKSSERDRDVDGLTLLMWAVALGSEKCIKVLMEHNADPVFTNSAGMSAHSIAENPGRLHLKGLLSIKSAQSSDSQPRLVALGVLEESARQRVVELEQVRQKYETTGDSEFLVTTNWELASLYHLLHDDLERNAKLAGIADKGARFFLSQTNPDPFCWLREFPMILAAASACINWEVVDALLRYPQRKFKRGERSPTYNPEYFEWPIWQYLSAKSQGKAKAGQQLAEMKTHSTRKSKAMLAAVEAIENENAEQLSRAVDRILAAEEAYEKQMWKHTPSERCLCAVASYFLFYAKHNGLMLRASPDWDLRTLYTGA